MKIEYSMDRPCPTLQMMIFSFRKQFDEYMMRVYSIIYQYIKYLNYQNIVLSPIIKSVGIYTMTIQEAKQISIADYLQSLGYSPVKQQGESLWYKSTFPARNGSVIQSEH